MVIIMQTQNEGIQLNQKRFGISGNTLKLIMMLLMVLDHIHYFISPELASIFHLITRCVAVFFAFMAVEGFGHTHNRHRYIFRLFCWATLMFLGNQLINNVLIKEPLYAVENNIFLTLFAGVLMLHIISFIKKSNKKYINLVYMVVVIFILFASAIFTEGGALLLPFMLITYIFREKSRLRNLLYIGLSLLILPMAFDNFGTFDFITFCNNSEFMFISVLPLLYLYNGERGRSTRITKYIFYIFYPLHLWIIAIVAWLL